MIIKPTKEYGFSPYRFSENPLEKRFAEKFIELSKHSRDFYSYMLSMECQPKYDHSDDEMRAVNRIIQWLGTPVGRNFIKSVLSVEHPCKICIVQACCRKRSYECEQLSLYVQIQAIRKGVQSYEPDLSLL